MRGVGLGITWTVRHSFYRPGDLNPNPRTRVETPDSLVSLGLWAGAIGCASWPGQACMPSSRSLRSSFSKKNSWFERVQSLWERSPRGRSLRHVLTWHPESAINQVNAGACFLFSSLFFLQSRTPAPRMVVPISKMAPEEYARGWHLPLPHPTHTGWWTLL